MHDDPDRPGPARPRESREDSRRWGYDPAEDLHARDDRDPIRRDAPVRAGPGGSGRYGPGDRGGLGRDDDPPIDAEREPGGARHLAAGAGGGGDWTASEAGIGQRRGPAEDDRPFHVDDGPHALGQSYGGWADAGSMQARGPAQGPRGDDTHDAPPRPPVRNAGPKGWQRSDARIHDDVCVHLSRSELDASDVSVEVHDGHVALSGTVSDRPMKHAIESLVDACHGVRDIDNRIKVMRMPPDPGESDAPPRPHASVPQDSPTARDEARGRTSLPLPGGAGKSG